MSQIPAFSQLPPPPPAILPAPSVQQATTPPRETKAHGYQRRMLGALDKRDPHFSLAEEMIAIDKEDLPNIQSSATYLEDLNQKDVELTAMVRKHHITNGYFKVA